MANRQRFEEIELSLPPADAAEPIFLRDCPACGVENPTDNIACDACGIVFSKMRGDRRMSTRNMGDARKAPPKPKRGVNPLIWLLLIAGLGAAGWFFFLRNSTVVLGAPLGQGRATVVLLHSFGAPGDALVPRAQTLSKTLPGITWILPAGPHGARGGRAWVVGNDASAQQRSAADSRAVVRAAIERATQAGVAPKDIYLGGYAQGAQVALAYALAGEGPQPAGLILLSGGHPSWPDAPTLSTHTLPTGMRVFIAHGENDAVVSITQAARQRAQLIESGAQVEFQAAPGGHMVDPSSVDALTRWLSP